MKEGTPLPKGAAIATDAVWGPARRAGSGEGNRLTQIGLGQQIRLEWMEMTANLAVAVEASICNVLQELLEDKLSVGGNAKRGNREKAITILMKIWVRPPRGLHPLQRKGLNLLGIRI